jgi:hypothetical protein
MHGSDLQDCMARKRELIALGTMFVELIVFYGLSFWDIARIQ